MKFYYFDKTFSVIEKCSDFKAVKMFEKNIELLKF